MDIGIILPLVVLVVCFLLNVPIAFSMIATVVSYFLFINTEIPVHMIMQRMVATTESSSFLAIPFFITAGAIMNYSGITKRLMGLAELLVGHFRGGLAHVNVLLSTLMGGISGSAAADAATQSKILVPEMEKRGYPKEFSAAVTLSSSLITPIIPPGIGLILYGFLANVSVGRMFVAGYIPGIITALLMMGLVYYISRKKRYMPSREKRATAKEIIKAVGPAVFALFMPFGIILGLRFGIFTATECGAIAAVYSLLIGIFVYREIKWKHAWPIIKEAFLGTATVMILICTANLLAFFLTYERIPHTITELLLGLNLNKYTFLLLVNVLLLIMGMFMEGGASLIILAPLLAPVAQTLGIDLVHFGIVMVFNIGIGNMSPPFGVVLFQTASLLDLRVSKLTRASLPFLLLMIFVLLVITFWPDIVTFLPNLLYG